MTAMTGHLPRKRILVVEDDYIAVADLLGRLDSMGVSVVGPAPTVEDALKILSTTSEISGAILDINLDGQMVFTLADELERRSVPFFFLTGYARDIVPGRHADRPFLQKPFNNQAISSALGRFGEASGADKQSARLNNILGLLPDGELEHLLPLLSETYLPHGAAIETQFEEVRQVYFPISFVGSVIAQSPKGARIETGLIGREGLTGFGLVDGDRHSPYQLVAQVPGYGLSISTDSFLDVLGSSPVLDRLVRRFSRSLAIQVSYTTLANGHYTIPQRLARWLLMLQDRAGNNSLAITHEYLSIMLGVRRPGVTEALHVLEGDRLIKSSRGKALVMDRPGLIRFAGDLYGIPEAEYVRLMGIPLKGIPLKGGPETPRPGEK